MAAERMQCQASQWHSYSTTGLIISLIMKKHVKCAV